MPSSRLARALTAAGIPYETSALLRDCTTFRIGGPAALLCRPHTQEQLVRTLDIWRTNDGNCPLFILGRGSNVLFPDNGFPGLVICTRDLQEVSLLRAREGTPCLRAGCGAALAALSRRCAAEAPALSGLEFACGIPGTLGGAVVMNAGAHQSEMANVVRESVCIFLSPERVSAAPGMGASERHAGAVPVGYCYRTRRYGAQSGFQTKKSAAGIPKRGQCISSSCPTGRVRRQAGGGLRAEGLPHRWRRGVGEACRVYCQPGGCDSR